MDGKGKLNFSFKTIRNQVIQTVSTCKIYPILFCDQKIMHLPGDSNCGPNKKKGIRKCQLWASSKKKHKRQLPIYTMALCSRIICIRIIYGKKKYHTIPDLVGGWTNFQPICKMMRKSKLGIIISPRISMWTCQNFKIIWTPTHLLDKNQPTTRHQILCHHFPHPPFRKPKRVSFSPGHPPRSWNFKSPMAT